MTIKQVYENYKYLDKALSDVGIKNHFAGDILYDCWQAIRSAYHNTAEEPKPNGCCSGKETMAGLMFKLAVQIESLSKNIEEIKNNHLLGASNNGITT